MCKATKEYANRILKLVQDHYPDAKMILNWRNNFELRVAIILSAQCTDKKVNEVSSKLFPKYRKERDEFKEKYKEEILRLATLAQDDKLDKEMIIQLVNFAPVPLSELEQDIKSTGFYHNKAKSVQNAARVVLEKYHGIL